MKNKLLILMLLILCFWPITIHLTTPQAKQIPPTMCLEEVNIPTPKDPSVMNKEFNKMCHKAAGFGYEAVSRGLTKEQMHQELREILK